VYNNFKTDKDAELKMTPEQKDQRRQEHMRRWQEGIKMYRVWNAGPNVART
jgi:hypothetical protein